ncbi:hypothetical protein [Mechercharimyces sp. CAU 1602]|nr:hypothetical protein [Mechercharimyces sp. CAU 1602]MCS1350704.1 hypothetical protein [Mechercharimyces sp. CAU 1602]
MTKKRKIMLIVVSVIVFVIVVFGYLPMAFLDVTSTDNEQYTPVPNEK